MDPERVVPSAKRSFEANSIVSAERVRPSAERRENIGSRCVYTKEQEAEQVCRIRVIGRLGKGRAFLDADERHGVAIAALVADQISCGQHVALGDIDRHIVEVCAIASDDRSAQKVRSIG